MRYASPVHENKKCFVRILLRIFGLFLIQSIFDLIAKFSLLIHAALLTLDLEKKVTKEVFSISNDDACSV